MKADRTIAPPPAQASTAFASRAVAGVGVGTLVIVCVLAAIAYAITPPAVATPELDTKAPGLEVRALPNTTRPAVRNGDYRWIEREAGIAAVPLDVAAQLYLERAKETR